ncbi:aa3-type cytochrome c oxidase subunit IV [Sphingomonas sp. RB3P16]
MAADNELQVHRATYDKVINVMKYGAVAVFIIAFVVVWLVSGK